MPKKTINYIQIDLQIIFMYVNQSQKHLNQTLKEILRVICSFLCYNTKVIKINFIANDRKRQNILGILK